MDRYSPCPVIFVDARMISATGIGRHLSYHLSGLAEGGLEIVAGVRDKQGARLVLEVAPCAKIVSFDSRIYSVGEHWKGSLLTRSLRSRISLFWYPHYNVPWLSPRRSVVSVHDLIQIRFPSLGWNRVRVEAAKLVLRRAVRRAERVVCVSAVTATDLVTFESSVGPKVHVISNGLSKFWRPLGREERDAFRQRTGLRRFLLAVGNKKQHKNFDLLFRVMDGLGSLDQDLRLVVIGRREPWWSRAVADWKRAGGAVDRLVDLEGVSDRELLGYYSCAEVLLMPSLYEGFGLPPLEAMACGVPVISSDGGALPETVGNAAVVLQCSDLPSWIRMTRRAIRDTEFRQALVQRGFERAKRFSSGGPAHELRGLFEDLAASVGKKRGRVRGF